MTETIYAIGALASAIAAVLAWLAKLKWSSEYGKAKDETIKAKEAQISSLKEQLAYYKDLTPMKIREYFSSVKEQLEEYNDLLQQQLDGANQEIGERNKKITELEKSGKSKEAEVRKLVTEKADIEENVRTIQQEITETKRRYESDGAIVIRMPKIDVEHLRSITEVSQHLRNLTIHSIDTAKIPGLSRQIEQNALYIKSLGDFASKLERAKDDGAWAAYDPSDEEPSKDTDEDSDDDQKD